MNKNQLSKIKIWNDLSYDEKLLWFKNKIRDEEIVALNMDFVEDTMFPEIKRRGLEKTYNRMLSKLVEIPIPKEISEQYLQDEQDEELIVESLALQIILLGAYLTF